MEQFFARPEAIARYSELVGRAGGHVQGAQLYLSRHCDLRSGGEGVLSSVLFPRNDLVHAEISKLLAEAVSRLRESETALADAARHYEATDESSATRIDRTVPPGRGFSPSCWVTG